MPDEVKHITVRLLPCGGVSFTPHTDEGESVLPLVDRQVAAQNFAANNPGDSAVEAVLEKAKRDLVAGLRAVGWTRLES